MKGLDMMIAGESKADRIRKHAERITARDERERDAARAVIDDSKRREAIAAKIIRLREQRLARESAEREAAAAMPAPAKKAPAKKAPAKKARRRPVAVPAIVAQSATGEERPHEGHRQ
jgi:hypothetical protein